MGVSEILATLGLKDHGTSGYRGRAVFHYEPLLRLHKLEIPSLFGRLLRDEGMFLDRADPTLFQCELEDLLMEFGPLIWPSPSQGPRDHLLKPNASSLYTSDLVYPRDKGILIEHLRNWVLSKHARPDVDVDALIEKRHKDANLKIFETESNRLGKRRKYTKSKYPKKRTSVKSAKDRLVSLTDSSSEASDLSSDSDAPLVNRYIRSRARVSTVEQPFRVALRLYRKIAPEEEQQSSPCHSYGIMFIDNSNETIGGCFSRIRQHVNLDCTYIEFHPPEDMTLEGSIRIDHESKTADDTFERVMSMFREARKFPGEPSYRTIEAEIGIVPTSAS